MPSDLQNEICTFGMSNIYLFFIQSPGKFTYAVTKVEVQTETLLLQKTRENQSSPKSLHPLPVQ